MTSILNSLEHIALSSFTVMESKSFFSRVFPVATEISFSFALVDEMLFCSCL